GSSAAADGALGAAGAEVNDALEPAGAAKRLAEELELLEAVRAAVAVPPTPLDAALESLAGVAAEALSCELGLLYVAAGERLGIADRGWSLRGPRHDLVASPPDVLGGRGF